jgi:enamine deaminase RidA (YjgF/YER057c/UK114 family)
MLSGCATGIRMVQTPAVYTTHARGFSQAVAASGLLFASGQVGWNTAYRLTGTGSFDDQLRQSFINIAGLAKAGNSSVENILLLRFYVKDLDDAKKAGIGFYMQQYFPQAYKPATTLLGVQALARPELLVEIEMIAKIISPSSQ